MNSKISSMIWESPQEEWYQVKCPCTLVFLAAAVGFSVPYLYKAGMAFFNAAWLKIQQRFAGYEEPLTVALTEDMDEGLSADEEPVAMEQEHPEAGDAPEDL